MARQRMGLGEWGGITLTAQVLTDGGTYVSATQGARPARWRARAKIRDLDGKVRDVERYGPTRERARKALEAALRDRVAPASADAEISPNMLVLDAAEVWWNQVSADARLSPNTRRVYRLSLDGHILRSSLAHLAVREVKVSAVDRALASVVTNNGPAAAKMARSVLRGVLDLAVRHDAIPLNPVRAARPLSAHKVEQVDTVRDPARSFTVDEVAAVLQAAATGEHREREVADLLAFLAGTGARIGEACALRWSALDLTAGTAQLGPTVVRATGKGLQIQEQGKTKGSTRTVDLPDSLVSLLRRRKVATPPNELGLVFPSSAGTPRDPSNTANVVRDVLNNAGVPWATSHTFRKRTATGVVGAGLPVLSASVQLGHARTTTTDQHYLSKRNRDTRMAQIIEDQVGEAIRGITGG